MSRPPVGEPQPAAAQLGHPPLGHHIYGAPIAEGREVVLLLNGGMMTHPSWADLVEPLIEQSTVVGCDFRGQLLSPGPSHPRLDDNVDDVVALLDALGVERVHVLGASFGGLVSLLLTARHPERVLSLAVVTAVDRTPPGMQESSRRLQQIVRDIVNGGSLDAFDAQMLDDLYSATYRAEHGAEVAERQRRTAQLPLAWFEGLMGILQAIEDFDLNPHLASILCPVLVVHAAHDTVMPGERVRALAAALPDAELAIHPTSGHALILEDPDWLVQHYLRFLVRQRN